jgi:amidohydrolase
LEGSTLDSKVIEVSLRELKQRVCQEIDSREELLREIAKNIHDNPEVGWETPKAVSWLTEPLREAEFEVSKNVAGLSSAFTAEWPKKSRPRVAIVAEYDALTGIGHGCGHNLIGTAAVGAALALKAGVPDLAGQVLVVGTPFEEGGGGKIIMVEKGVFTGTDAAMLCHPSRRSMVNRGGLAALSLTFKYYGKESHASSAPEQGISALDAVLMLFFGINQLRQFGPTGHRIHGIITKGGTAPNIIPAYAEATFSIRAINRKELVDLRRRVITIAEAAATATFARLEVVEGLTYAERHENPVLSQAFASNLSSLGERVDPPVKGIGSSDMGNVGEVCPMIHPYVKVADESVPNHTHEFAQAAGSEIGMQGMLKAAKALAMTTLDLCYDSALLESVKADYARYRAETTPH